MLHWLDGGQNTAVLLCFVGHGRHELCHWRNLVVAMLWQDCGPDGRYSAVAVLCVRCVLCRVMSVLWVLVCKWCSGVGLLT